MIPEATPIDGSGANQDPATPHGALSLFYRAFNGRNLDGLAQSWLDDARAVMDNPVGGITRGWPAIRAVYEKLVAGETQVRVEFHDYTIVEGDSMFVAIGRERGTLTRGDVRLDLAIRTSRFFQRHDGRWRQVHHHGSIDDPAPLDRYQRAVRGED